ncbi:hypothetical protein BT69DRAFT_1275476 [Atractiella rhizophila]|nr:hypothetical protein BT69DRAFT_1275476 [Atractiella rhizophila]
MTWPCSCLPALTAASLKTKTRHEETAPPNPFATPRRDSSYARRALLPKTRPIKAISRHKPRL